MCSSDLLSPGIFVNSITAFEGFADLLRERELTERPVLACFDWDPFAVSMPVPVLMMRQDVDELMRACFAIIDTGDCEGRAGDLVMVPPQLAVTPRPVKGRAVNAA